MILPVTVCPTIDGCFAGQDDDDELQAGVGVLQVPEHGLHAVCPLSIFTEARLSLDGHPSILRDLAQLVSEAPAGNDAVRPARLLPEEDGVLAPSALSDDGLVCKAGFVLRSLQDLLSALPLGGKAGDGPHLDLHPGVELLPPHVPHAVTGRGHCAVLKGQHSIDLRWSGHAQPQTSTQSQLLESRVPA